MPREYIELQALQAMVKEGLAELFPGKYWVRAEIAQWAPQQNGHCYLSLTQSRGNTPVAEARAVIWRTRYEVLKHFFEEEAGLPLQAGITVLVRVQVSFHETFGYTLVIDDIDPAFTVGEKALARQKTIERLTAEGYLDLQKELGLPLLPSRLAVISARTAAGWGDFRNHLENNAYGFRFHVELFEALMQGETAPDSIVDALERIRSAEKPFDAVLILRGGGSDLDLSCFDDYGLAVAIATFETPVFTAIGHEKDLHVADLAAHRSVKTPTALADLFIDCYLAEDEHISALALRIRTGLSRIVRPDRLRLAAARFRFAASARVGKETARVDLAGAKVTASDPRTLLSRGYVLVTGADGTLLKSAANVRKGDCIGLRFADGSLRAAVEEVRTDLNDNTA